MIQTWHITPTQNRKLDLQASSLDDVTRQLPEGYYSTFRTFDGGSRALGLETHLLRLYEPVSTPQIDSLSLRRQLAALLGPYRPGEARVRAMMTKEGKAYIAIEPLRVLPREIYEKGVQVETIEIQREHPHLKSTTFISQSESERKHIAQTGIFEALLVKDGKILEGMTSNFFYIRRVQREGILYTARDDILLGITRQTVLDIAQRRGLGIRFESLRWDQLRTVEESFLTSSSRGIVPIVKIDDITIGPGQPGPITKELSAAYEGYVLQNAEPILPGN